MTTRKLFTFLAVLLALFAGTVQAQHTENREIYTSEIRESVSGRGTLFPNGIRNTAGAGRVPPGRSVTEGMAFHSTIVHLSQSLAITDAAAAGAHGSALVYTFPEGRIHIVSSHADITITCDAIASGLTTTATHEFGFGTAAAAVDNAALTSTEEDIIAGVAADLTASAIKYEAVASTAVPLDGSAAAKAVYANLVFAADDSGAAGGTCSIVGPLTMHWVYVGDD